MQYRLHSNENQYLNVSNEWMEISTLKKRYPNIRVSTCTCEIKMGNLYKFYCVVQLRKKAIAIDEIDAQAKIPTHYVLMKKLLLFFLSHRSLYEHNEINMKFYLEIK